MYNDYENKSICREDFNSQSRLMSYHHESVSKFGSELYAPTFTIFIAAAAVLGAAICPTGHHTIACFKSLDIAYRGELLLCTWSVWCCLPFLCSICWYTTPHMPWQCLASVICIHSIDALLTPHVMQCVLVASCLNNSSTDCSLTELTPVHRMATWHLDHLHALRVLGATFRHPLQFWWTNRHDQILCSTWPFTSSHE